MSAFCDARHEVEGFVCDLMPEHEGRHVERWVASWEQDGSDPRLYSGVTTSGRHVYREPVVSSL